MASTVASMLTTTPFLRPLSLFSSNWWLPMPRIDQLALGIQLGHHRDDFRGADVEADYQVVFRFLAHSTQLFRAARRAKPFG